MSTVLVIGASRGIGLELVRQYGEAGERVIATVRDEAGRERVRGLGAQALIVDVAQPASVSGLAWLLDGEKIDTALYVAGVMSRADATEPPTQPEFDRVMHTNVLGAMQVIPQVAPLVAAANQGQGRPLCLHLQRDGADRHRRQQRRLALPRQQGGAEHGGGLCPAQLPRRDHGGDAPRLGADRDGRRRRAADGAGQRACLRTTLATLTPADRGRFLQHDGTPYTSW